jgi:bifunctional DNase/RNase
LKEFVALRILSVNPSSVGASSYILLLEGDNSQALRFPIVIGSQEAQSISVYLEQIQPSRPLTHDLCVNLLSHCHSTSIDYRFQGWYILCEYRN